MAHDPYQSNIWKIYLYKFIRHFLLFSGVLVPFFTDYGHVSFSQIMILESVYMIAIFLLETPTGAVADYFGRKWSLFLSGIIYSAAWPFFAILPTFWGLMIAEITAAVGYTLMSGADQALAYDSLKKIGRESESKKVFGRMMTAKFLGMLSAAPIGSIIAAKMGLEYPMLMMGATGVLTALISLTLKEPPAEGKKSENYFATMRDGLRYFKEHKIMRILTFDCITISALSFLMVWIFQPLLQGQGMAILYLGFVQSALLAAQILTMNTFSQLEKLFGRKGYLFWSAIISGAAFILIGISPSLTGSVALLIIIAAFGLTREILFFAYMNRHISSDFRATVMSTVSMLKSLLIGILYPFIGLLMDWSIQYTFICIGILIFISTVFSRVEEHHLID